VHAEEAKSNSSAALREPLEPTTISWPFTSFPDTNLYDYTYIDKSNSTASPTGRQFVQAVYPGTGYFTVAAAAAVPEPASLAVMGLFRRGIARPPAAEDSRLNSNRNH
jgi:hypothetical protein